MISRTALHTLRATVFLAQDPRQQFHGAAEIAESIEAPANYLGKLLQTLARKGILISQKGSGGGFKLARPPHEVTLYEVVDPIDDVHRFSFCFLGQGKCSDENPCALHKRWGDVRNRYRDMLEDFTLADLAHHSKKTAP
ncbi:MAG: Rrf2 family transcriptional regulator [Candidatus Hydrogenedentota bacterium]